MFIETHNNKVAVMIVKYSLFLCCLFLHFYKILNEFKEKNMR